MPNMVFLAKSRTTRCSQCAHLKQSLIFMPKKDDFFMLPLRVLGNKPMSLGLPKQFLSSSRNYPKTTICQLSRKKEAKKRFALNVGKDYCF